MDLILRGLSGTRLLVVLEQGDGLARGLQRQFAVGFAADNALGLVGVHIRVIEQSHFEFPVQHRRDQFVELRFLEHALADEFDEVQVAIRFRQFDIDAGAHSEGAGFLFVLGDAVAVGVGTVAQFPDGIIIRNDEALETPFLAQHVAQQPSVRVRGTPSISL